MSASAALDAVKPAVDSMAPPQLFSLPPDHAAPPAPARSDSDLSQADTLVRSASGRSTPPKPSAQAVRSIFPTYDPDLPLDRQPYAPRCPSPCRAPRAVARRPPCCHDECHDDERRCHDDEPRSPDARSPPRRASRWPARPQQPPPGPPPVPTPSSADQLWGLWKAANGWKASAAEARVYCLAMARAADAPVYTLSSADARPLYALRLDPTSAAANVTLSRRDPAKPLRPGPGAWLEALATTLEAPARPGLVAHLVPSPAAAMARAAADAERARLVWDAGAATHLLVHPALAAPLRVAVARTPAYSRSEYALEHPDCRRPLAKLTCAGSGAGWLEIDTGVAATIDAFYIVDVAVAALILAACAHGPGSPAPVAMQTFEPPPPAVLAARRKRSPHRFGRLSLLREERKRRYKMDEFDIDVEKDGSLAKGRAISADDKLPFLARVLIKLAKGLFKCAAWTLTIALKCLVAVLGLLYKCVGSKY